MIKNKEKVFKALQNVSAALTCLALTSGITAGIYYRVMNNQVESIKTSIRLSAGYVKYIKQQSDELYQLYKTGEITGKEYNRRLNALLTCEDLDQLKPFASDEVIQSTKHLEKEVENAGHICVSGLIGTGVTVPLQFLFAEKVESERAKKSKEEDNEKEL